MGQALVIAGLFSVFLRSVLFWSKVFTKTSENHKGITRSFLVESEFSFVLGSNNFLFWIKWFTVTDKPFSLQHLVRVTPQFVTQCQMVLQMWQMKEWIYNAKVQFFTIELTLRN